MAWEDRTPAEQAQARREAATRAATDDTHTYDVVTSKGTQLVARGINSAKVLAGKDGTYTRRQD